MKTENDNILTEAIRAYTEKKMSIATTIRTEEEAQEITERVCASVYDDVVQSVKDILTEEEKERIQKRAQHKAEVEQFDNQIKKIRNAIIEGVFLAFVVGLFVNQMTNLIAIGTENKIKGTIIACIILFVILAIVVLGMIISQIIDFIKQYHRKTDL